MRSELTTEGSAAVGGSPEPVRFCMITCLAADSPLSGPQDTVLADLAAVRQWPARAAVGVQRGSQMTSGMSRSVWRW